jgi:hypothetical protein
MEVQGSVVPCSPETPGDNIVIVDDGIDCRFLSRTAAAIALPAALNYQFKLIDHRGCRHLPDPVHCKPSLLQLFIRGNPFRGSAEGSRPGPAMAAPPDGQPTTEGSGDLRQSLRAGAITARVGQYHSLWLYLWANACSPNPGVAAIASPPLHLGRSATCVFYGLMNHLPDGRWH